MLSAVVRQLHRHLLSLALVGTTLAFVLASYAREGMTPLEVLPTLATAALWHEAGLPLAAIALACALLTALLAGRHRTLRLEPALLIQGAATGAAALTYSYDLCQDAGLSWLPAVGGCHCWLTGAAALFAAGLSTLLLFAAGLFSFKIIRLICAASAYLRRCLYRPFAGRLRRTKPRYSLLVRVRLIAFRGPPFAASMLPAHLTHSVRAVLGDRMQVMFLRF
jgi:hypothetical protein